MNKYENELDIFLFDILEISKKTNLKVWLEAGTLLGCERNNNYIPWETDIDLGCWNKNITAKKYKKFKRLMKIKKYIIIKQKNMITMKKHDFKCHADIAIYKKVKNIAYFKLNLKQISKYARILKRLYVLIKSKNIRNTLQFHKFSILKIIYLLIYIFFNHFVPFNFKTKILKLINNNIRKNSKDVSWKVPFKFLKKIKKKKFRKFNIFVPYKSKEYLKWRYGDDWLKPRSNWNQFEEDKTLVMVQNKNE